MEFFKRTYLSPQGISSKESIEGFVPQEDMPVVTIANGFIDVAKWDELGVYATVRYDLALNERVAYGLFHS